jgi:hypothetical protein
MKSFQSTQNPKIFEQFFSNQNAQQQTLYESSSFDVASIPGPTDLETIVDRNYLFSADKYILFLNKLKELIRKKAGLVVEDDSLLNVLILEPVCEMFSKISSFIENLIFSVSTNVILPEIELKHMYKLFLKGLNQRVGRYKVEIFVKPLPSTSGENEMPIFNIISGFTNFEIPNKNVVLKPSYFAFLTVNKDEQSPHPQFVKIVGEKALYENQECYSFIIDVESYPSLGSDPSKADTISLGDKIVCKDINNFLGGRVINLPFILKNDFDDLIGPVALFDRESLTKFLRTITEGLVESVDINFWLDDKNLLTKYLGVEGATVIIKIKDSDILYRKEVSPYSNLIALGPFWRAFINDGNNSKIIENIHPFVDISRSKFMKNNISNEKLDELVRTLSSNFNLDKTFCSILSHSISYNNNGSRELLLTEYHYLKNLDYILSGFAKRSGIENILFIYQIV